MPFELHRTLGGGVICWCPSYLILLIPEAARKEPVPAVIFLWKSRQVPWSTNLLTLVKEDMLEAASFLRWLKFSPFPWATASGRGIWRVCG